MSNMDPIEYQKSQLLYQYIDMEKRIQTMHKPEGNNVYCKECFQDYPCDTITKGINNEKDAELSV